MRMEWIVPGLESPRCEAVRGTSCGEHWHWHRCNVAHVCQCLMAVDRETCLRRWLLCDGKGFTRRTHVLLQHDRPDLQAIVHWQMRCLPNMPLPLMMAARRPSLTRWQLSPSLFVLEATPLSVGWQMILSVLFSLRCWPFPARCQVLAGNSAMGPLLVVPLAPRVVGTVQARDRGLRDKCNSPLWQLVLNQLKIQYR